MKTGVIAVVLLCIPLLIRANPGEGDRLFQEALRLYEKAATSGDYLSAIGKFKHAAVLCRSQGRMKEEGEAYKYIGLSEESLGEYGKALRYFHSAKKVFESLNLPVELADIDRYEGDVWDDLSQYGKALDYYRRSEKTYQALNLEQKLAYLAQDQGIVYEALSQYGKALHYLAMAERFFNAKNDFVNLASSWESQGVVYRRLSQYERALDYFGKAEKVYRAKNLQERLAGVYQDEGIVYDNVSRYRMALEYFENAGRIYRERGVVAKLADVEQNEGIIEEELSEYRKALDHFEKAARIYQARNLAVSLAFVDQNKGIVYRNLSRYRLALACYGKAEKVYQDRNMVADLADIYEDEGVLYSDLSQYERAMVCYGKAQKIYQAKAMDSSLAAVYESEGVVYDNRSQYEKALTCYGKAEKIYEARNMASQLAHIYQNKGVVYTRLSSYQEALTYYGKAEKIYEARNMAAGLAAVYVNEGVVYSDLFEFDRALACYGKAQEIYEGFKVSKMSLTLPLLNVYVDEMLLYEKTGKYHEVYRCGRQAIRRFNRFQQQVFTLGSEQAGLAVEQRYTEIFDDTTWAALKEGNPESAFSVLNEGKMRIFQAMLQRNAGVLREQEHNPAVRALWSDRASALRHLADLELLIPRMNDLDARRLKMIEYEDTENKLSQVENELNEKSRAYRGVFGEEKTTVLEIQRVLKPGTQLLEYAYIRGEPYLFSITPRGFHVVRLAGGRGLSREIRELVASVTGWNAGVFGLSESAERRLLAKSYRRYLKLVSSLSDALVGHGILSSRIRRLVIVPDRELFFLPFGMLRLNGIFLAEKYPISYLDMASELLNGGHAYGHGFLGYGGINYYAKGNIHGGSAAGGVKRGSLSTAEKQCDLPSEWGDISTQTLEEVKAIQRIFGGKIESGARASKTLFELEAPGKRYIHLATHGWTSSCVMKGGVSLDADRLQPRDRSENFLADPLTHSFLLFAGALYKGEKGTDDGYLTPLEVMGVNLRGVELVTLSACQTGLGRIGGEEGVFGLRRAFLLSGAENLVVSEWEVPDVETRELMVAFYRNIRKGETISRAFWKAEKREIGIVRKRYGVPHPYFWSAFVHVK